MTTIVIGIDPGITGGVAVLTDGKFEAVYDMPVQNKGKPQRKRSQKTGNMRTVQKQEVSGGQLYELLNSYMPIYDAKTLLQEDPPELVDVHIFIEQVNAGAFGKDAQGNQRTQGVTSAFSLGYSFGCAASASEALTENVHRVRPQDWKKFRGLTGLDKDAARLMARGLYENAQQYLERKRDSGRADAIMIADYGYNLIMKGAS